MNIIQAEVKEEWSIKAMDFAVRKLPTRYERFKDDNKENGLQRLFKGKLAEFSAYNAMKDYGFPIIYPPENWLVVDDVNYGDKGDAILYPDTLKVPIDFKSMSKTFNVPVDQFEKLKDDILFIAVKLIANKYIRVYGYITPDELERLHPIDPNGRCASYWCYPIELHDVIELLKEPKQELRENEVECKDCHHIYNSFNYACCPKCIK